MSNNGNTDINENVNGSNNTEAVHFLDYWQILYSRKEFVIAVTLIMFISGIFFTKNMPNVYEANALIEVQRETQNLEVFGRTYTNYDPIFLKTQFEIIRSDPIIEQVVRNLQLDEDLGRAYNWIGKNTSTVVFERTVQHIQRQLRLDILPDTQLISLSMRMDKPDKPQGEASRYAVKIVNEIAKVFMNWTQNRARELKESGLTTLKEEISEVERQINKQEDDLSDMRAKYGITVLTDIDTGTASIRAQISQLDADKNQAEMTARLKGQKYDRFVKMTPQEAAASLNIFVGDNSLMPLLTEKRRVEIELSSRIRSNLGPNHPEVIQLKAIIEEIDEKIRLGVEDIKLALQMDYEQAKDAYNLVNSRLEDAKKAERELATGVALDYQRALTDLKAMKDRRLALEDALMQEQMKMKAGTTSVQIIQPAKNQEKPLPVSPNFALNISLSLVAGVFFGIVIAFFVEYLDTTIKTADDIEKYLNINVIGVIPQKMRVLNDPHVRSRHFETYRVLRMNLKSSKKLGSGKVVAITSASAGEGKSMTVFNLAYVCAEVGEKVLLIDADLHRPRQHKIMDKKLAPGLSNVIVGEATFDEAVCRDVTQNLDFLPAGRISNSGVYGLLDTDEMREILDRASKEYDRVFIDVPPMIGVSDTAQIVRMCDGVAMVVQHRKYPRVMCNKAKNMIVSMGGNLLGVILNNINVSRDYSSYYYQYQYYYYYDSDQTKESRGSKKS